MSFLGCLFIRKTCPCGSEPICDKVEPEGGSCWGGAGAHAGVPAQKEMLHLDMRADNTLK